MRYSIIEKSEHVIQGVQAKWLSFVLCLVSLGITAFFILINYSQCFWFPMSGIRHKNYAFIDFAPNNVINGVQFAAKAYEILVVMCLGAMAIDVYKRHLVKEGVPYGLLTGAYQVSDIMLIFNHSFWRSAPQAIWLAFTLVVSVILGTLVGPASAILIVPKMGLYSIPNAFTQISLPLVTSLSSSEAWPQIINDETVFPPYGCQSLEGSFVPECPAGGFSNIYGWTSGWTFSGLTDNITFMDPSGQVSRRLDMISNRDTGTFLSTPTAFTVSALGQFKSYLKGENVGRISETESYKLTLSNSLNYQPLVNAKCQVWNNQADDFEYPIMRFPSTKLNCFSDDTCNRMRDRMKEWHISSTEWKNSTSAAAFYVANQGNKTSDDSYLSSLIFTARAPYIGKGGKSGMRIVGCSYMAHWLPTKFWANSTDSESIATNLTDLSIFSNEATWKDQYQAAVVNRTIAFDNSYLPYLALSEYGWDVRNNTVGSANIVSLQYLLQPLQDFDGDIEYFLPGSSESNVTKGDRLVEEYFEKITGALITDAVARTYAGASVGVVQKPNSDRSVSVLYLGLRGNDTRAGLTFYSNNTLKKGDDDWAPYNGTIEDEIAGLKHNSVTMDFRAERYGYGYGLASTALIFAYVTIALYVVAIVTYWVVTLAFRADTVVALSDFQDLLVLAWRSRTPIDLERNAANAMNRSLRQKTVAVRATTDHKLALVLDKDQQEGSGIQMEDLVKEQTYW